MFKVMVTKVKYLKIKPLLYYKTVNIKFWVGSSTINTFEFYKYGRLFYTEQQNI